MTEITVPTLGESVSEATVGEWQVSEGDAVKKDDILVELETDKVSVEVRAEEDGVISKIVAQEGDTVEIGDTIAETKGLHAYLQAAQEILGYGLLYQEP